MSYGMRVLDFRRENFLEHTSSFNRCVSRLLNMPLSTLSPLLERIWCLVQQYTNSENDSIASRVLRILLTVSSFCFIYTKAAGTLLNAMVYLVDHHWYLLAITCALVVLGISLFFLAVYQWMWRWQQWVLGFSYRSYHRLVVVDDDDNETVQHWFKKIGRAVFVVLCWAVFCLVSVRLDYLVFWSQYSDAHPEHNLELIFVNSLQAGPILMGAAYALSHIYPDFYQASSVSSHRPIPSDTGESSLHNLLS